MESAKDYLKDKLKVELQLMKHTDLGSLTSVLQSINQLLWADHSIEPATQKLHHYIAKLVGSCESFDEPDRLKCLNDYFFGTLDFQVTTENHSPSHWLLEPVVLHKSGNALIISLIYLIFAERLHLPISLLNHKMYTLLKWTRPKESNLIDLSRNGSVLSTKQIIETFSQNRIQSDELEMLNHNQCISLYLNVLLGVFADEENFSNKLTLLDTLLSIEPSNLNFLGQRALLYKVLNQRKQSMDDLKRYFSYVDQQAAPDDIQNAYYELCLDPHPHNLLH